MVLISAEAVTRAVPCFVICFYTVIDANERGEKCTNSLEYWVKNIGVLICYYFKILISDARLFHSHYIDIGII